jgi:phage shock protein PspC (stress-responsive transcriptional regulator)
MTVDTRRLYRSRSDRMIAGICGGLGNFLGMDPTIVRLIVLLITFMWPFTPLIYLVMMLVVPEEPLGEASSQTPESVSDQDEQASSTQ